MGVYGLTTAVQNSGIGKRKVLENCTVIIDCWAIINCLYMDYGLDTFFGGQSYYIYKYLSEFIDKLLKYNVVPIVVCDGLFDPSLKEKTKIKRMNSIMKPSPSHNSPLFSLENYYMKIFAEICRDREVVFIVSDFEADRDISLLSNFMNAPIISNDSDFYIFNSLPGMISIRTMVRQENVPMEGNIVNYQDISKLLDLKEDMLSLYASLCGNDLIDTQSVNDQLTRKYGRGSSNRIKNIAKFIKNEKNEMSVINEFRKLSSPEYFKDFAKIVLMNKSSYNIKSRYNDESPEDRINKLLGYISISKNRFELDENNLKWSKLNILYHQGLISPNLLRSMEVGVNFLTVPFQDFSKPSCHEISTNIRLSIYKFLAKPIKNKYEITEYDRVNLNYIKERVLAISCMNSEDENLAETNPTAFINKELGINCEEEYDIKLFTDDHDLNFKWDFIIIIIKYLKQNSTTSFPPIVFNSFLLGLIRNIYNYKYGKTVTVLKSKDNLPKHHLLLFQFIGYYTSIFSYLETYNTLLNKPIYSFPLRFVFDGPCIIDSFINLHYSPEDFLSTSLKMLNVSTEQYDKLLNFCLN